MHGASSRPETIGPTKDPLATLVYNSAASLSDRTPHQPSHPSHPHPAVVPRGLSRTRPARPRPAAVLAPHAAPSWHPARSVAPPQVPGTPAAPPRVPGTPPAPPWHGDTPPPAPPPSRDSSSLGGSEQCQLLVLQYRYLHLDRLKYLAIVVDSKEAKNTVKIRQLLCWLSTMGVKYICLYDIEGVMKKSFEPAMEGSRDGKGISASISHSSHKDLAIECLSGSDGKEGIAKAANLLCSTYLNGDTHGDGKTEPTFTEADMASALKAVGCGGPEPDLLLMYGPARCHFGFPAWRLRYTEIMHMGPLKSMKYGAIMKALYNFSKKYQNYGK